MAVKVKVCPLLAGKTKGESIAICASCLLPSCYLNPCPHCGGHLYYDEEDKEFRCYNCAHPLTPLTVGATTTKTQTNDPKKKKQASVPVPIELKRTVPYHRPLSPTPTNGNGAWYSFSVFRFTREQIFWAISNSECFSIGDWPPMPPEFMTDEYDKESKKWVKVRKARSTYTDAPTGRRPIHKKAHFEHAKIIIGDIESRLKVTKTDGKLLKAQVQSGITDYELLEPEAQMALDYISLWDFRKRPRPYSLWKAQKNYYHTRKMKHYGSRLKKKQLELTKSKSGLLTRVLNSVGLATK